MASGLDPYRTLGVAPGASLNEIKSAYRRLVKQYHPDRAGERALPRFLSIQAAYEQLVDGEGRLRPPGAPRRSTAPRPQEAWRADPNRARASRDAWRARRSGASGGGAAGASGAGAGAPGATGEAAGSRGRAGSGAGRDGSGPTRERPRREHGARRGPRKATPGSTTYDEAEEVPFEPEWDGGSWYGPSSGTYWTINPREYADPRKHGPEYLERARRAMRGGARRGGASGAPGDASGPAAAPGPEAALGFDEPVAPGPSPDTDAGEARWRWETAGARTRDGGPTATGASGEWGTRSWRYDDLPPPDPGATARPRPGAAAGGSGAVRPEDVQFPDLEAYARRFAPRHLLELGRRPGWQWRLALALTGWPPIGYALATLLSEATGCAALAPTCPEPLSLVTLLLQPLVVAVLFLAVPAAAVAAFAGIVALAVALPIAAVLSAGSLPDPRALSPVLGVAVAAAYFVGFLWGAREVWGEPGSRRA